MDESLDEVTFDYEEDGILVRKQLDRAVLTTGGWPTMMFLFQELDRKSGAFRAPKMTIVRFKKSRGSYRKQASFNISSEEQARQIAAVFDRWLPKIATMTAAVTEASGLSPEPEEGEQEDERDRAHETADRAEAAPEAVPTSADDL